MVLIGHDELIGTWIWDMDIGHTRQAFFDAEMSTLGLPKIKIIKID